MKSEYQFEIPDCHPSLNSYLKKHWTVYHRLREEWNAMVWACVKHAKIPMIEQPVEIHIDYYHPRKSVDLDNYTPKLLMDSLKGLVIKDDSSQIVKKLSWRFIQAKVKKSVVTIKLSTLPFEKNGV